MPGQALQDERVEVEPVEDARREQLAAEVGLMRAFPLLPRMQQTGEAAHRVGVNRTRGRVAVGRRQWFVGCWRIGVERGKRQRRRGRLRKRERARGDEDDCSLASRPVRTPGPVDASQSNDTGFGPPGGTEIGTQAQMSREQLGNHGIPPRADNRHSRHTEALDQASCRDARED